MHGMLPLMTVGDGCPASLGLHHLRERLVWARDNISCFGQPTSRFPQVESSVVPERTWEVRLSLVPPATLQISFEETIEVESPTSVPSVVPALTALSPLTPLPRSQVLGVLYFPFMLCC